MPNLKSWAIGDVTIVTGVGRQMKHVKLIMQVILVGMLILTGLPTAIPTASLTASVPTSEEITTNEGENPRELAKPTARRERIGFSHDTITTVNADALDSGWPMAGANPQRTSWVPEEVRGQLSPVWHRAIEPYISQNVQIIAANGLLHISTARGLYALDAANGHTVWVYPTELPLGHSPTYHEGVLYV
ncbi:MAG: hypothetical protein FJ012_11580, partial [Chloroflexi bacterium]|nr:hypothetical protein [Chloroflexota bacterium]